MRNFLYAFKVVLLCLFTVRHYASAEYAVALCLSVCLFVPSESSLETAKHIITQTSQNSSLGHAQRGTKYTSGRKKLQLWIYNYV